MSKNLKSDILQAANSSKQNVQKNTSTSDSGLRPPQKLKYSNNPNFSSPKVTLESTEDN